MSRGHIHISLSGLGMAGRMEPCMLLYHCSVVCHMYAWLGLGGRHVCVCIYLRGRSLTWASERGGDAEYADCGELTCHGPFARSEAQAVHLKSYILLK